MTNDLAYNIIVEMLGQNKVLASVDNIQKSTSNMVQSINKQLSAIKLNAIIDNVNRVADGINSLNGPGMNLSTSMHDLSAMTGVAGDKLKEIEGYAREAAKTFGGSAADGAESYKLVLGQLSPEIAKVPTALKSMGETIQYTSKLMGGDTTAAAEVLTTAMNQYGISLEDPTQASKVMAAMMNVMAAAAGEGAAELPQIKQALEQSGMAAKSANVAFEETNAAIQVLDKAGKKGSEGGVALRNVLSSLGQGRFLPKRVQEEFQKMGINIHKLNDPSLTLSQRLNHLKPLLKDSALMSALFGKENANAAMALIGQTTEMDRLTTAVKGTTEAYDQAAIVMEGPAEKNARLKASVDDLKITLFNATNGWMGYASVVGDTARDMANLAPIFSGVGSALSFLTSTQKMSAAWTKVVTVAQWAWNAAMTANPIGLVIVGVSALIALIVVIVKKWDSWGAALTAFMGPIGLVIGGMKSIYDHWESIKQAFTTEGIGAGFKRLGLVLLDSLMKPFEQILKIIDKVTGKNWSGKMKQIRASYDLVTAGENATNKTAAAVNSGIVAPVKIPGSDLAGGAAGGAGDKETKEKGKKTNESIATGGTKHNYVTLNIRELIGIQHYAGSQGSATRKLGEEILDEMLRVTASATTAAG